MDHEFIVQDAAGDVFYLAGDFEGLDDFEAEEDYFPPPLEHPFEAIHRLLEANPDLRQEVEDSLFAAMADLVVDPEGLDSDEEERSRMEDVD